MVPNRLRSAAAGDAILSLSVLLWLPGTLVAQTLVGSVGFGRSAYDRLGSPVVAGAELRSLQVAGVHLRFGARRAWDHVSVDGRTCDIGWPYFEGCQDEAVRTDITMTSKWFGLGYGLRRGANSLEVGIRRTRHQLDGEARGVDTGRPDAQFIPGDPIDRWGFDVSVGRLLGRSRHFGWRLTYSFDPTDFHGCATDVGTPFCGGATVHVLSLGFGFGTW